ncbi:hypothetical protein [Luteolibacter pohnpeiensis]|uniref:hypothetical protein n=1 Tax=Luteolibacter pohnpeiensis TaxID=454153 RepID=UPI0019056F1E|nr:hypothetical protein [Luteolibacter pohnpeiensis]
MKSAIAACHERRHAHQKVSHREEDKNVGSDMTPGHLNAVRVGDVSPRLKVKAVA